MFSFAHLTLLMVVMATADATSFWESRFSTTEFAQTLYLGKYSITIFQHLTRNNSFYMTPLVLLDHRSGRLHSSSLTGMHELRFRVIMWNNEMKAHIENFLVRRGYRRPDVKILPMEKVRFQWRSRVRPILRSIVLENEFMSTHHMPSSLTLAFACKQRSKCLMLMEDIASMPDVADRLVLECFMTTQKSAIKKVTVTMSNLMDSSTYSKLMHLPSDKNYRYLRSDDFNEMAQQTFSSVKMSTIRSSEYVDKSDELNIVGMIERALKQDEILATSLSSSQWNSVFWNPIFTRPDKVVKEATKVFTKDATTGKLKVNEDRLRESATARRLFNSNSKSSESGGSGGFSFGFFSASGSGSSKTSSASEKRDESDDSSRTKDSLSKEEMNTALKERNLDVEWNGERFVVRPMQLVRLNERKLRTRREIVSDSMQLTLYQQALSLKVRVAENHNQTEAKLAESAGSAFPTHSSYCLLSNGGSCPPGFTRSSGFIKAINVDTNSFNMVKKADFGDSSIRCHSPDNSNNCRFTGWHPYKAEIHLHACCR